MVRTCLACLKFGNCPGFKISNGVVGSRHYWRLSTRTCSFCFLAIVINQTKYWKRKPCRKIVTRDPRRRQRFGNNWTTLEPVEHEHKRWLGTWSNKINLEHASRWRLHYYNEMSSMSTNCAKDYAHGNFWNIGEKGQTAIADAKMRRFWLCNKTRRK